VVSLHKGASVVRCLDRDGERVVIAVGRNKQARVPLDRVLLATGLMGQADAELEALAVRVSGAAAEIDLLQVWELVVEDGRTMTLSEIADLHFGTGAGPERVAALATHLLTKPVYFKRRGHTYAPRSAEEIERTAERERSEAEREAASAAVMDALAGGQVPQQPSDREKKLLADVRAFAVHGDEHPRADATKALLNRTADGSRDLQERAFDLLVGAWEMAPDEPIEIERAGLGVAFPAEVENEAQVIAALALRTDGRTKERRDLTGAALFTIDDRDTLDRDDALCVEQLGEGRVRVGIHIADAGALVPVDGPIDREADRRMATLYTPDMRVPMVPSALSEGAGSILPDEERLALSLLVTLKDGEVDEWELFPSVVRAREALTYEGVDEALRSGEGEMSPELRALGEAADQLRARREAAGALVLERAELSIKVTEGEDGQSRVSVDVLHRATPARRLVTEMMVLCNSLLARFCINNGIPAAYRTQPPLDPGIDTDDLDDPVARYRLMGRLSPAEVTTEPGRHHGLGVDAYLQATSPLRRYPDLVMQRQFSSFLATGSPTYPVDEVASVAQRAEVQLRELAAIENQRRRYWLLRYLAQQLDEGDTDYEAVVLDTDRRGPPVLELVDYPFRVRAELPHGASSSDRVVLRLHDVDLWRRVPHFVAVD
jgi:exoribonuclease-2